MHVLSGNGTVMTWGRGKSGQLGHGNSENQLEPKVVEVLKDKVIHSVAAGWNHSGFVSGLSFFSLYIHASLSYPSMRISTLIHAEISVILIFIY